MANGEAVERGSEFTMNMSTGQSWVKYGGPGDPPGRGDPPGSGDPSGRRGDPPDSDAAGAPPRAVGGADFDGVAFEAVTPAVIVGAIAMAVGVVPAVMAAPAAAVVAATVAALAAIATAGAVAAAPAAAALRAAASRRAAAEAALAAQLQSVGEDIPKIMTGGARGSPKIYVVENGIRLKLTSSGLKAFYFPSEVLENDNPSAKKKVGCMRVEHERVRRRALTTKVWTAKYNVGFMTAQQRVLDQKARANGPMPTTASICRRVERDLGLPDGCLLKNRVNKYVRTGPPRHATRTGRKAGKFEHLLLASMANDIDLNQQAGHPASTTEIATELQCLYRSCGYAAEDKNWLLKKLMRAHPEVMSYHASSTEREARRLKWTTVDNLLRWHEGFEKLLVDELFGFMGPEHLVELVGPDGKFKTGKSKLWLFPGMHMRIFNVDETSIGGLATQTRRRNTPGRRGQPSRKTKQKDNGKHSTLNQGMCAPDYARPASVDPNGVPVAAVAGGAAVALPPQVILASEAANPSAKRPEKQVIEACPVGTQIHYTKTGSANSTTLEAWIDMVITTCQTKGMVVRDEAGKRIIIKLDGGPALNLCPDWLQRQKSKGVILFPGLPNGSSANQVSAWLSACAAIVLFQGGGGKYEAIMCTKASHSR